MARGRPSKRQLILDSAIGLIAELGYQGTSIDLVVQKAGVSKPTVYNNFPTKQALFQAYLEQMLTELELLLSKIADQDQPDSLRGLIDLFNSLAASPAFLAIYRVYFGEQHKLDDVTRDQIRAFQDRLKAWGMRWLLLGDYKVSEAQYFIVMAILKEGIIVPALSDEQGLEASILLSILEQTLAIKA